MARRTPAPEIDETTAVPLGGTRAQAMQRLQVGASLLLGIVLIVGLANVIEERANQSDEAAVSQSAATVTPEAVEIPANDPLADAGVVPDLPTAPSPTSGGTLPARDGGR